MSSTATAALPRWDVTAVYPSLEAPEFAAGFIRVLGQIEELVALFDAEGIDRGQPDALDGVTVAAFERVTARLNGALEAYQTLEAYLDAFVATDARNETAQARASELRTRAVALWQLLTRYTAWVGGLDVPALVARSTVARDHAYPLEVARVQAAHQMSPAEEALAAALNPSGGGAWGRLYDDVTSRLTGRLDLGGEPRERPISEIRNLAFDPDRETRRRAYAAELAAWESVATPLAAALNGVKGEVDTLARRRGWDSPLDAALLDNRIDRATLEAMLGAAREAFPDFRRYLRTKARALGVPALAWYDLFAPVGEAAAPDRWAYDAATAFLVEQFGSYSPRLAGLAERAFRERWVDAEPRPGKRDGAFCMWLRGDESRILTNYQAGWDGVSTLAHELGHAYHTLNETGLTPLQRQAPMTLAETASTFCETVIRDAALRAVGAAEQVVILEGSLQGACQVVVDIAGRFLFEERVFARRRERELSVEELNALMLEAQAETYGDGLDPALRHPAMWEAKGHYYGTGFSYYNFPYMFGQLFGLGLYARFQADPAGFRRGYDDLLRATGLVDPATLASRFGIDVRSPAFWRSSLDLIRADIDRFAALLDRGNVPGGR